MWRIFWTAAGAIGAILAGLIWASTQVTFLFHHPRTEGARIEIDKRSGAAVVMRPVSTAAPAEVGAQPRAEAPQTEYDFGMMNPHTTGRHKFIVQNSGSAPLALRVGSTSCKCTLAGLADKQVPPGESTTVTLEWTTGAALHYAQYATIHTNDPQKKSLDFGVQGQVRMAIGFDEHELVLDRIELDKPTLVERLIYSQLWDDFTVKDVESKIQGLSWKALPVEPASARHLEPKTVQRLRLTIPGDLPAGRIEDSLRVTVQRIDGDEEVQHLELPFSGIVPRRLAIYGAGIDEYGVIDLGDIREGQGKRMNLLVKVRDPEPDLPMAKVEIFPSFLAAELKPRAEGKGLYDLTLEVPPSTPTCQYHSNPLGRILIDTGHPRVGALELKVTFAVVPWPSL